MTKRIAFFANKALLDAFQLPETKRFPLFAKVVPSMAIRAANSHLLDLMIHVQHAVRQQTDLETFTDGFYIFS
ncbi:MAG: hypothetical protein CL912_12585 [Deltaproteobacteria bacterium]|nr:hypothetical protein [Deltaproteobacteria bacterium]